MLTIIGVGTVYLIPNNILLKFKNVVFRQGMNFQTCIDLWNVLKYGK